MLPSSIHDLDQGGSCHRSPATARRSPIWRGRFLPNGVVFCSVLVYTWSHRGYSPARDGRQLWLISVQCVRTRERIAA